MPSRVHIQAFLAAMFACGLFACQGSYSDDGAFSLSSLDSEKTTGVISQSLHVVNTDVRIAYYEYRTDLGGNCDSGDAKYNCIEATMTRGGTPVAWAGHVAAIGCSTGLRSRCENGHFSIVIPKPDDSALCSGTGDLEYQVHLQMKTSTDNSTWEAGLNAPVFTISIQRHSCP